MLAAWRRWRWPCSPASGRQPAAEASRLRPSPWHRRRCLAPESATARSWCRRARRPERTQSSPSSGRTSAFTARIGAAGCRLARTSPSEQGAGVESDGWRAAARSAHRRPDADASPSAAAPRAGTRSVRSPRAGEERGRRPVHRADAGQGDRSCWWRPGDRGEEGPGAGGAGGDEDGAAGSGPARRHGHALCHVREGDRSRRAPCCST